MGEGSCTVQGESVSMGCGAPSVRCWPQSVSCWGDQGAGACNQALCGTRGAIAWVGVPGRGKGRPQLCTVGEGLPAAAPQVCCCLLLHGT